MHALLSACYRDHVDAAVLLEQLAVRHRNTDFEWEAILARSYTTVLPRLFGRFAAADIGAHLGVHTDALLRLPGCRRVDCFEPQPRYLAHLRERYRRERRVRVHGLALSDSAGERRFVVNETAPGESGLRERSFYNVASVLGETTVPCERLDALRWRGLEFVKIDTEGGEIDILRGATLTIGKHRPLIALEFGIGGYDAYGHAPADLLALAAEHDCLLTDLFFNTCAPDDFAARICSRFYWDYFLLPREHLPAVRALKREGAFG